MHLTVDEVRRIASLAGLRVEPEEARRLVPQMGEIVRFVEEMEEPEGAEPGPAVPAPPTPVREAEDEPRVGLERQTVLANAPDHRDGSVRVPPVRSERNETRSGKGP